MFKYVHHILYLVNNRDEMVEYLDKNFGLKPDHLVEDKRRKGAFYCVDKTEIQIEEPIDPTSKQAKHLAKNGPGVAHVAWAVDNLQKLTQELLASGHKIREEGGFHKSPNGYLTSNVDPASSHGLRFQLIQPTKD